MQGYIKDFRQELDSDIWLMPPLYHRVWQYLKYKVNHRDNRIPLTDGSFLVIKAGQRLTSVRDIAKDVGWYERGMFKEPNPKTITSILEWLVSQKMIIIDRGKGNRQYTLITLINWERYQSLEDESNSSKLDANTNRGILGNNKETGEHLETQGFKRNKSNGSNTKVTAKEQSLDINNNDKECIKNDSIVVVNKTSKNKTDEIDKIANRYADLKSIQQGKPCYPNAKDYQAITQIVTLSKVPSSVTIELLDQCFRNFEVNNPGQSINSFGYCQKYILGEFKKINQPERSAPVGRVSKNTSQIAGKSYEQAMAELERDREAWGG